MDISAILISQYLAALEMLRQTIAACPDSVWDDPADPNRFWQTAYHALFFTHVYVNESEAAFVPWARHRPELEDAMGFDPTDPYDKETILDYLEFCRNHVAERVPQLDLAAPEGFHGRFSTLELQIYSIRHIMQHAGELMERVGSRAGADIDWVGKASL